MKATSLLHFVGRKKELALLESAYSGPASAFIPVYGRRRVGKSELILRFMEGKAGVFFLGKKAPARQQIAEFLSSAAEALGIPILARLSPNGWREALTAVCEHRPPNGRLILALDEFQWIVEASPDLPSVLQELWDRTWSRDGSVVLLLCGSFVGFMEREVLGRRSPCLADGQPRYTSNLSISASQGISIPPGPYATVLEHDLSDLYGEPRQPARG